MSLTLVLLLFCIIYACEVLLNSSPNKNEGLNILLEGNRYMEQHNQSFKSFNSFLNCESF